MFFACQDAAVAGIFVKKSALSLKIINDKTPQNTSTSSGIERALNWSCYPHNGNDRLSWLLNNNRSWSVGFAIQDEALDAAAHNNVDSEAPLTEVKDNTLSWRWADQRPHNIHTASYVAQVNWRPAGNVGNHAQGRPGTPLRIASESL